MAIIEDGSGKGYSASVNSENRLKTAAVTEPSALHRASEDKGFNINTGPLSFTTAGTFIYLKNNEDDDLVIEAIAVGVNGLGTHSDIGVITIIDTPTGGDLLSDQTAVSINRNRKFGSAQTLVADVYSGKSGGTVTGGDDALLFYQGANGRLFAGINLIVPKGSSIAIKYDPKLSSGTVSAYCALICYLSESV
jgi:hypothetical protein